MGKTLQQIKIAPHYLPHNTKAPMLALKGVTVKINQTKALDDVSFELNVGERVAIVGPNGAGKSTLFNVIAGVLTPQKGQVHICGNDPSKHICIAYVPQRSEVDWNFPVNVADVVMMGRVGKLGPFRWPSAKDKAYVYDCLDLVSMTHLAKRQISELSGGQQQRVFIARALAQETELMLMDEPLNGLDIKSQETIFTILDKLRHRNVTVLIATHDLNLAAEKFDRLMLINQRIIGFGQANDVFTPDLLSLAYGGNMRVINNNNELVVVSDSCCGAGNNLK